MERPPKPTRDQALAALRAALARWGLSAKDLAPEFRLALTKTPEGEWIH